MLALSLSVVPLGKTTFNSHAERANSHCYSIRSSWESGRRIT